MFRYQIPATTAMSLLVSDGVSMRVIRCNHCGRELEVKLHDAGRPVRVPGIGDMVTVRCESCGKWLVVTVNEDPKDAK